MRLTPILSLSLLSAFLSGVSPTGVEIVVAGSLDQAKISLHVTTGPSKGICLPVSEGGSAPETPCWQHETRAATGTYSEIYLIAGQANTGNGFTGISCGIEFDPFPENSLSWFFCGDTQLPYDGPNGTWPAPGSAIRAGWETCQMEAPRGYESEGALAVLGVLRGSFPEPTTIRLAENPFDPAGAGIAVYDCAVERTVLPGTSVARVTVSPDGASPGYNPCLSLGQPDCVVSPTVLTFNAWIPSFDDEIVVIENHGTETLWGKTRVEPAYYYRNSDFTIISGKGQYRLEPGETQEVVIRYLPDHYSQAVLLSGDSCPSVQLSGSAQYGLKGTPGSIDFGVVEPGQTVSREFEVTNVSPIDIWASIIPCRLFELEWEDTMLAPGQSLTVSVRFSPLSAGTFRCGAKLTPRGPSVILTGTATNRCRVEPRSLDFGQVELGTWSDLEGVVVNYGDIPLEGSLEVERWRRWREFTVIEGAGDFSLAPGESLKFVVRFQPVLVGTREARIMASGECDAISCTGDAVTHCRVDGAPLNFGAVPIGETAIRSLNIYSNDNRTLSGEIAIDCRDFALVSGGGPFTVSPGEVHEIRVSYSAKRTGVQSCTLETGLVCGPVTITAFGRAGSNGNSNSVRIALHVLPPVSKTICPPGTGSGRPPLDMPCSRFVSSVAEGAGVIAYVMALESDPVAGIAGVTFGIDYQDEPGRGVDIFGWTSCGDLQFPSDNWPAAGTGNLVTWNHVTNCQKNTVPGFESEGVQAVAGAFYVYAYSLDLLQLTPRGYVLDPGPYVSDCSGNLTEIPSSRLGITSFSPEARVPGCNPCVEDCPRVGPLCAVLPGAVDFGEMTVGKEVARSVFVLNPYSSILHGRVGTLGGAFKVVSGGGKFVLEQDGIHEVEVRFAPSRAGEFSESLDIGATCSDIILRGTAMAAAGEPGSPLAARAIQIESGEVEFRIEGSAWNASGRGELRIYDVQGRLLHQTEIRLSGAPPYWRRRNRTGSAVSAGVYFARIQVKNESVTVRFVVLP